MIQNKPNIQDEREWTEKCMNSNFKAGYKKGYQQAKSEASLGKFAVKLVEQGKEIGKSEAIKEFEKMIKERKWVWNEERFGGVKNHRMFDEFVKELLIEIRELGGK